MLRLVCSSQQINHAKVKKLFLLSLVHSEPLRGVFLHTLPPCLPPLPSSTSSRHWEAVTLINGEPSSALKARGSKWRALIKVEHWETRDGGRREECRTHSPITVNSAIPG